MIKVASVELYRDQEVSSMVTKTYQEEVRGYLEITWAPQHVVFHMPRGNIIAYKADRIHEIVTYNEEQQNDS